MIRIVDADARDPSEFREQTILVGMTQTTAEPAHRIANDSILRCRVMFHRIEISAHQAVCSFIERRLESLQEGSR
jgi:hypothetical protein